MVKEAQIIRLSDDKEYIVIKKINAHSFNYLYLITVAKPFEFLKKKKKLINGVLEIDEIKDNTELDYALYLLKSV